MRKLCVDFGCGYNPKKGYKTCDVTTNPMLDYQYDGKDNIVGLKENSVDVFYLRNVVHHIPDLWMTFTTIRKYLKYKGHLIVIDCNKESFKANTMLDRIWYRFVNNDSNIFISEEYRNYTAILETLGFKPIDYKHYKLKEKTEYERN